MTKLNKKGLIIVLLASLLLLSNTHIVQADEFSQIETLSEVTEYASLSIVVESEDAQVLGSINVKEEGNNLVIIDSETKEELIVRKAYTITKKEYEELCKIVQAEAGNQDEKGKILVANVIMNRVENKKFADNIHDVIFTPGQFTPIQNGMFKKAIPTEETKDAVNKVLDGENYSEGSLYFRATSSTKDWGNLKILFSHGGHKFYK